MGEAEVVIDLKFGNDMKKAATESAEAFSKKMAAGLTSAISKLSVSDAKTKAYAEILKEQEKMVVSQQKLALMKEANIVQPNKIGESLKSLGMEKAGNLANAVGSGMAGAGTGGGMTGGIAKMTAPILSALGPLGVIAALLSDMPIVGIILKMMKAVLLLPMQAILPILKPVLIAWAYFMSLTLPIWQAIGGAIDIMVTALGSFIANVWEGLKGLGEAIWKYIVDGFAGIVDIGKTIWEKIIKPAFDALASVGTWIWEQIVKPAFDTLASVGTWIWEQIIKPAFSTVVNFGTWIWDYFVLGLNNLANFGTWIWDYFVLGLNNLANFGTWIWDYFVAGLKDVADFGTWIWNLIKSPFAYLGSLLKDTYNWFANSKLGQLIGLTAIEDGIVQNGRVITTHPDDYIVATKNPQSLGGNKSVNITISNNTFGSRSDVDYMMRQLTQQFRAEMRAAGR